MDATADAPFSLTTFLLGPAGGVRTRTVMSLMSLLVFLMFAVAQHVEVQMGLIDRQASHALTVFGLTGAVLFVAMMRADLRLPGIRDPSMTVLQITFALVAIAWSYGIHGPARGAVISIMLLILVFGMFALSPRESRTLGWLGFMLLSGVMAYKTRTDPQRYPPQVELIHFGSAAIIAAGVVTLSSRFGRLRTRLLQQRADLTEALERIHRLASRDELTGILNRRAMIEQLTAQSSHMQRGARPMCLLVVDLDHFKRINDTFGHKAGDLALQAFANLATRTLDERDVIGRWGGEEFLLMLPETSVEAGIERTERLRQAALRQPLTDVHPSLVITFSAGLSPCRGMHDIDAAIERADQAMYRAKTMGRNRTELAPPIAGA
ncbi:diguanylate cyclase (GGDEF)-like protein [Sphaerotilus hippei]|uniref:diguanylate cyclase n=1 Tax=Sphaerotilus hippei TaxID=744406 RepID=A0A318H2K2_9BURK|nr:GGDEF domain-containing protein [Sphaerotilus hippei]PXW97467.1 diguanylate cyclase (GGDEF)-like protein [Sphaerotilus hippei]